MAELTCENDCTKHEVVQIEEKDKEMFADFIGGVDYQFSSATYDEKTKDIVIRLKEIS
tara:strand:+ start:6417 stop:6590 length:174 start_codon:yes stop_codon:yes gene_type:complete